LQKQRRSTFFVAGFFEKDGHIMSNEKLNIETPVETPVEAPVDAPSETPVEAPAESPAETQEAPVEIPAPPVTPAAPKATATVYNPIQYFLKSNIFKAVTVLLMIVYVFMALYLPVFTVSYEHTDALEELGIIEEEGDINFSLMDVVNNLGDEIKLCYTLDDDDLEDLKEYAEIQDKGGKFTDAVDVSVFYNASKDDGEDKNFFSELFGNEPERGIVILAYLFLPIPLLFLIGLAISCLINVISTLITFFKPSAKIKKLDSSVCLTTTIFFALCYVSHLMMPCFNLNFVVMGVLAAVSIAALVFEIIYKKYTVKIINDRLGL
jgi:hypothetical protein